MTEVMIVKNLLKFLVHIEEDKPFPKKRRVAKTDSREPREGNTTTSGRKYFK
ncbi:MAG UNVERIFIED_CONTAM: hypothetical protein LVQ98_09585 [Rickettsiaceae bacterium]